MKKIVSLLLVFALLFGFASCSVDKPEKPDAETTTVADETGNNTSSEKKNAVEFLSVYTEKAYEYETYTEEYYYLTEVNYQKLHLSEENKKEYACPSVIAVNKETAEILAKNLKSAGGKFELVFTRNENGRKELFKCRKYSYINANSKLVKNKKIVK